MKFSINKKNFYNSLIEHNKVVPLRTTLPILSCVVLVVKKERLTLKTSDLEQTIISDQTIKTEKEGAIALPIGKLLEIVSVYSKVDQITSTTRRMLLESSRKDHRSSLLSLVGENTIHN